MLLIQISTFHNNFIGCSREWFKRDFQANSYLFKVNNRNTRKRCEKCSKLIKTPDVNDVVLLFLLLTLNIFQKHLEVAQKDSMHYSRVQQGTRYFNFLIHGCFSGIVFVKLEKGYFPKQ